METFLFYSVLMFCVLSSNTPIISWKQSNVSIPELNSINSAFIAYYEDLIYILSGYNLLKFPLNAESVHTNSTNISLIGYQVGQGSIQVTNKLWMLANKQQYLTVFDLDNQRITQTISIPVTTYTTTGRCVTNYNQYILVFVSDQFHIYNTLNKTWTLGTSLTTERLDASCNTVWNTVYVIGGYNSYNHLNTIEYMNNCCNNQWIQITDTFSTPIYDHRSLVLGGYIYVIRGFGTTYVDRVDIIDTISKTILPTANKLPLPKREVSTILVQNVIYIFGGYPFTDNEHYQYGVIQTMSPSAAPSNAPSNTPSNVPTTHPTNAPTTRVTQNESTYIFYAILAFIFSMSCGSICAFVYNKNDETKTDDANWTILILLAISVGDFVSDILLTFEILYQFNDHDINQSKNSMLLLHISGFGSIIFLILPYFINIYMTFTFENFIAHNKSAIIHFNKYRFVFIMTMLLSGSTYISVSLLSSGLFGFELFCSGLTKYELDKLSKLKVFGAVITENIPQLGVQIIYAIYKADVPSNIFIMSCISSLLSIISVVLSYFMQRRSVNYIVVEYELEMSKINEYNLTKSEKQQILQTKECKKALRVSLCAALNIDQHSIEFGKVTMLNNGVSVRVIHYVFGNNFGDTTQRKIIDILYNNHQKQVNEALSFHYKFELQFSVNQMNVPSQEMQNTKHEIAIRNKFINDSLNQIEMLKKKGFSIDETEQRLIDHGYDFDRNLVRMFYENIDSNPDSMLNTTNANDYIALTD
eukprot:303014_1